VIVFESNEAGTPAPISFELRDRFLHPHFPSLLEESGGKKRIHSNNEKSALLLCAAPFKNWTCSFSSLDVLSETTRPKPQVNVCYRARKTDQPPY
jgi:hypothetical protein